MALPSLDSLDDDAISTIRAHFMRRIDSVGGHWLWNGHVAQGSLKDYPRFYLNGSKVGLEKNIDCSARKLSLLLYADGVDEEQASVVCDHHYCVRPDHLVEHSEYSGFDRSQYH